MTYRRLSYNFRHWMFKWVTDAEGDIGLQVAGLFVFLKYKEHTIVYFPWNKEKFTPAGKWQGYETPAKEM